MHPIQEEQRRIEKGDACRSHNVTKHDFFISYRVATEGKHTQSSKEPALGIIQQIYDKLAIQRAKSSLPLFVFWDKQCLNYAENWEDGFLNGLKSARVIILLLSNMSLSKIIHNASISKQDNVLIEYECAIIQNKLHKVPVLPIFISEINKSYTKNNKISNNDNHKNKFIPLKLQITEFPDVPHSRTPGSQGRVDNLCKDLKQDEQAFLGSVKKTMAEICMFQGFTLPERGENKKDMKELISVAMQVWVKNLQSHLLVSSLDSNDFDFAEMRKKMIG